MERLSNLVYVIERYSSVSQLNVVECVVKTFDVAQRIMHSQIQNDINKFVKNGYNYPVVSSSVDTDDERVTYKMNFKHDSEYVRGDKFNDIYVRYSISRFVVVPTYSDDWVTI